MDRIVILGNGLLGTELQKQTGYELISRKNHGFDITKPKTFETLLLETFDGVAQTRKYDIIVNCIAYTDVYSGYAQQHWDTNYKGVADLVDFCNKWKIKLVHISTDYVYTNSKKNASEKDIPIHGDNWYSYTKVLADAYIELKSENYLICRGTHKKTPFPYHIAWIDQIGNFDYVDRIGALIAALIKTDAKGVFNIGTELKSMFELAKQTSKIVGVGFKPEVVPRNVSMNINKLEEWIESQS